ncbi:MAG: phosphate ABC transporter substrate-binding protein, partial [Actinomycetota bacterium]
MKRKFGMLIAAGITGALLVGSVPAYAGDDGVQRTLAAAGSDTTAPVLGALAAAHNINSGNVDGDRVVSVPPLHSV